MTPGTSNPLLPRSIVHIKKLQRASRHLDVIPYDPERGIYVVESATRPGKYYEVVLDRAAPAGQCTCPWAQHGGVNCKHVLAALRLHYASQGTISFWRTHTDARRQHRRLLQGNGIYVTLRPRRSYRYSPAVPVSDS